MSSSYTSDSFFCDEGGHFLDNSFSDFTLLYESQTGFCRLYRAKRLGKWFVLKCLKPGKVDDEFCRAMLQKEFSIGYNLSHPAIARTEGLEEVAGLGLCIVMEYVDGQSLRDCIKEHRLSLADASRVADELCQALSYIHGRQTVHRDLKPANIMLTNNGRHVKLVDFGLSDADDFAVFKEPAGTRRYAAPEQFDKDAKVDARADIYALGLILAEVNASLPHRSRRLAKVASRCARDDRDKRYASADEVADALRPRQVAVPVIVLLLLVIAAVAGYGWWRAADVTTGNVVTVRDTLTMHTSDTVYVKAAVPPANVVTVRDTLTMHTSDTVYVNNVKTVHTSDTVYVNKVETVMQHSTSPIESFNSDPRLARINKMARETTLRMFEEAYAIYTDTSQPRDVRYDARSNVYFRVEAAIRKKVNAIVDPSLPEHSLYLNAAITIYEVTMREFNRNHSWIVE